LDDEERTMLKSEGKKLRTLDATSCPLVFDGGDFEMSTRTRERMTGRNSQQVVVSSWWSDV